MNTVQVDINSLKPYKNNPRNNDNAVQLRLSRSKIKLRND